MYILGISAFYHDSAACIINNGEIVAAAQEERFSRKKHDSQFPRNAIQYCLNEAHIDGTQLEAIVFYEKPFLKFERLLETYLAFAPKGLKSFIKAMPVWLKEKLFLKANLVNELKSLLGPDCDLKSKLLFSEHHLSHAASAFYPSPFDEAAVLTIDAVGEWTTTSVAIGNKSELTRLKEIHYPHSLGLLYSAFTCHAGFKVNSGEYKLMGLAPYGSPIYANLIKEHIVNIADDGSFSLDLSYFDFATGLQMTNGKFDKLFGSAVRKPESKITQREMDMAASIQQVTEEIVLKIASNIAHETGQKNLCLAGGVALNCVANGALLRENIFENIWVQPAAGDSGGALGACLGAWHLYFKKHRNRRTGDTMAGGYLGPRFSNEEIERELNSMGAKYTKLDERNLIKETAIHLSNGRAVGWMQGRMEFGPRALGARSILADPRSEHMQKQLNLKVKYRESFRPFAPSVLEEYAAEWFDVKGTSPYMLMVAKIQAEKRIEKPKDSPPLVGLAQLKEKRSIIPAVTHVDYSARIQTVSNETNQRFHALLTKFNELTGVPVLANTSFNVRGEPIICSPRDAYNCFMGTELDVLVVGDFMLIKEDQDPKQQKSYENLYELD